MDAPLQPGTVALRAGALGAVKVHGWLGAVALRARIPLGQTIQLRFGSGVFADDRGRVALQDSVIGVGVLVVNRPTLVIRAEPSLWLPSGAAVEGLESTVLSTGSVDPALSFDLVAGSTWLMLGGLRARLPLYAGNDGVRNGALARADARLGRRVGGGAVSAGISLAGQEDRGFPATGFVELAAIGGGAVPLDRWTGLEVGMRVPLWMGRRERTYHVAIQVGLNRVFGVDRS